MNKYAFPKENSDDHPIQMIYDEWKKMGKPRMDLDTRKHRLEPRRYESVYDPDLANPDGRNRFHYFLLQFSGRSKRI